MSLLDKLLEKKDVELYLKLRAEFLKEIKHRETIKEPLENREFVRQRFEGRIEELEKMLNVIVSGKIKDRSISYYRKLKKLNPSNTFFVEKDNNYEIGFKE